MKRWALLIAATVGLLLAADAPKDGADKKAEEPEHYAKVELKGGFFFGESSPGAPNVPAIAVRSSYSLYIYHEFELDFSRREDLSKKEVLDKLKGKVVVVTGTLELPTLPLPKGIKSRPRVVVSTLLQPVEDK